MVKLIFRWAFSVVFPSARPVTPYPRFARGDHENRHLWPDWSPLEKAPPDEHLILLARWPSATVYVPIIGRFSSSDRKWLMQSFEYQEPAEIFPIAWMPRPPF